MVLFFIQTFYLLWRIWSLYKSFRNCGRKEERYPCAYSKINMSYTLPLCVNGNYYKQQTNQTKTKLLNFGHILDNIAVYYKTNYIIRLQRVNVARDRNCTVSIERSNWVLNSYNNHLEIVMHPGKDWYIVCRLFIQLTSHFTSGYLLGGGGRGNLRLISIPTREISNTLSCFMLQRVEPPVVMVTDW